MLRSIRVRARLGAAVTLFAFTASVAFAPVAGAGIVTTEQALAGALADAERASLRANLARDEVRQVLVAQGVDPAEVQARVAALTDAEVRDLNRRFADLPAGGDVVGVVVLVFLVLLVTDLLGWTDVFPFTKKGALTE